MKFTAKNVDKIRPPAGKADYIEWDEATPGFGIRFRDGGAGAYMIKFFVDGKPGKMTFGKVGAVDFDKVKEQAVEHLTIAKVQKKNPATEAAKEAYAAADSFPARIEAFLDELAKGKPGRRPRSKPYVDEVRRSLNVRFANLHKFNLNEVTRKMVTIELDAMETTRGFRAAGMARAHLSSYYRFCMRKGYEGQSPVDGTESRPSCVRKRRLTPHELLLIWRATEAPTPYNRIVRLLMLTAMRKTIFGRLRPGEINREERTIEIGIEAGKSKNGEEFLLPMSRQVEAMVLDVLKSTGNREFAFGETAKNGFNDWGRSKTRLNARITALNGGEEIPHWVLHDFRRTFWKLGGDVCEIPDSTIDVCLYHVGEHKKGVKRHYNKRDYLDQKRDALQKWADFVDQLVHGKREFKVVSA